MNKGADKNFMQKEKNDTHSDHIYLDNNCWVHCFSQGAKKALLFNELRKAKSKMTQTSKKIIKNTSALEKSCQTKVLIITVNEPEIWR